MKIGDKVLVPNYIAFEKKSEAIALTVIQGICKISEKTHGKIQKGIEKTIGHYPNEFDMVNDREYEIQDIFILDDITIVQISSNNRLLWVWKFE